MEEIWKFSHERFIGRSKVLKEFYYYSSFGQLKKVRYDGKITYSFPTKGPNGIRIYSYSKAISRNLRRMV